MLGEAAKTAPDAQRYLAAYARRDRSNRRRERWPRGTCIEERPGLSIKLSALHPRYEIAQRQRVLAELVPAVDRVSPAAAARAGHRRHDGRGGVRTGSTLSLGALRARCAATPRSTGWDGLGLAVQAYQKRAAARVRLARRRSPARSGRRIMVRLVKGAYWDGAGDQACAEPGIQTCYPVYTRKGQYGCLIPWLRATLFAADPAISSIRSSRPTNAHTVA